MSQERVKNWLKNKYNLGLVGVLFVAFLLRLYFFVAAYDQPLWWDEAEYMATAKHWAFGVPYDVNVQRPPLFQLLAAGLLKIGLAETASKFLLVLVPSVVVILIIYLLGKEMFSKKVALIAAFTSAFIWSFLFWSIRFQPDFFSLSFQLLSILFFWKLFKENKRSYALYAGLFAALGFYFKISALLVPLSIVIFVVYKDGISFMKNKGYWIALLSFIVALIPFSLWQYIIFGNPVAFAPSYIGGTGIGQGWEWGWMVLQFFYQFPKVPFFILFLLGAVLALFNLLVSFDLVLKHKEKRLDPHLFSLILLVVIALFYIFYIRGTIEDRWVFLIIPFIMYFAASGLVYLMEKAAKYHKQASIVILILFLALFVYYQMQHTNSLIEAKKTSYLQVKESSLWLKENSHPDDKILSNSYTQATAYSEREIIPYPALVKDENSSYAYVPSTKDMMDRLLEEKKPRYLVVSVFERHPDWTQAWMNENIHRLQLVKAYFADQQQQQALLVIYEIKYT